MDPDEHEKFSFLLAKTLVADASRCLANANASTQEKSRAMELVLGFNWTKKSISATRAASISGLAQRASRLNCTKDLARKWRAWLHKLWFAPPELSVENPHKWWNIIATTGLGGRASEEQWSKLFAELNEILIFSPDDLSELRQDQLHIVSDDPVSNRLLGQLWRAVKTSGGAKELAERSEPSSFVLQGWDAHQLARAISADSAKESELGRVFLAQAEELGLSAEECDTTGPREKLRRIAESATSVEQISQFAQAGAQLNLLRNCDASLRSAAAGIRCWGCFCDVTSRAHFPPTEEGVLAWSSFFGAGRSFKIYVAHLEKACLLLGTDTSWKTRAVITAGYGLSKAGDRSFAPRPAISRSQLCELVSARSLQDGLALIALIGWSFLLRIPSECLPLCRQQAGEDLESEERLARRAVIGLQGGKLIIKLNKRKHMATGSRMARACICEDYSPASLELHIPQLLCPVCQLWPAIRQRVPVGGALFEGWTGKRVLAELRYFAEGREWPRAARLGTHSFRRGAARAILDAGGSFAQLLRSGQWHSSAYQLYLDLGHEEATAMASVLVEGSDDD